MAAARGGGGNEDGGVAAYWSCARRGRGCCLFKSGHFKSYFLHPSPATASISSFCLDDVEPRLVCAPAGAPCQTVFLSPLWRRAAHSRSSSVHPSTTRGRAPRRAPHPPLGRQGLKYDPVTWVVVSGIHSADSSSARCCGSRWLRRTVGRWGSGRGLLVQTRDAAGRSGNRWHPAARLVRRTSRPRAVPASRGLPRPHPLRSPSTSSLSTHSPLRTRRPAVVFPPSSFPRPPWSSPQRTAAAAAAVSGECRRRGERSMQRVEEGPDTARYLLRVGWCTVGASG
ncbi:hypothetical protein C8R46DRAFT_311667 [Mycena filopes]|nr:hypothetical protein C8R46DRAFT_311667 [Mycena filopes]